MGVEEGGIERERERERERENRTVATESWIMYLGRCLIYCVYVHISYYECSCIASLHYVPFKSFIR